MRCAACNAELADQSPSFWKNSGGLVEVDVCSSCKSHVDMLTKYWPSKDLAAVIQARKLHYDRHGNLDDFNPKEVYPEYGKHRIIHMVGQPHIV